MTGETAVGGGGCKAGTEAGGWQLAAVVGGEEMKKKMEGEDKVGGDRESRLLGLNPKTVNHDLCKNKMKLPYKEIDKRTLIICGGT